MRALVVGTIVAYIVTDPGDETTTIRTGVAIAPEGGTVITRMWSF